MVSNTILKDMNTLASREGGVVKDLTTRRVLYTVLQTTVYRLIKHSQGGRDPIQVAKEIYGSDFLDGLDEAVYSMKPYDFAGIVKDFCKEQEMAIPKNMILLQYVVEYIVQRGFVRPITQSPKHVNIINGVPVTSGDLLHVNEIYGLAGLPLFCNSITGISATKGTKKGTQKSSSKLDEFHRSATVFVQKH